VKGKEEYGGEKEGSAQHIECLARDGIAVNHWLVGIGSSAGEARHRRIVRHHGVIGFSAALRNA
jgi:ribulose-5-phosphate 4-epimerase/fuculose-1-phosphate aldolase